LHRRRVPCRARHDYLQSLQITSVRERLPYRSEPLRCLVIHAQSMREDRCNRATFIPVGEKLPKPLARPDGRLLRLAYPRRPANYGGGHLTAWSAWQGSLSANGLGCVWFPRCRPTPPKPHRRELPVANTSGWVATAAKPMSAPGTTNAIAAVRCRSLRSTILASAANVTAAHGCRSGHLPYERRVSRPQPMQICPLTRISSRNLLCRSTSWHSANGRLSRLLRL
jgi:hypothetical protein